MHTTTLAPARSALGHALAWIASIASRRVSPPQRQVHLVRGALHRIASPAQSLITCVEGCVWVTQDGASDDHVLKPGESLLLRDPGRVIVQALDASRCRIAPLARP